MNNESTSNREEQVRKHSYDGIQEFDKKLPNWWLWTFYGAIFFSVAYWFVLHLSSGSLSATQKLEKDLAALTAKVAARSTGPLSDKDLWAMSQQAEVLAAGKTTFETNCATCHGSDLKGGIGFNLSDTEWVHGGNPTQIVNTVVNGVTAKGMAAWGPVLGSRKINEVVAYVLSHHQPPTPE